MFVTSHPVLPIVVVGLAEGRLVSLAVCEDKVALVSQRRIHDEKLVFARPDQNGGHKLLVASVDNSVFVVDVQEEQSCKDFIQTVTFTKVEGMYNTSHELRAKPSDFLKSHP